MYTLPINGSGVQNGAGAQYIFDAVLSTPDDIAAQDATIAVSMLSKLKKREPAWWAGNSRIVIDIFR